MDALSKCEKWVACTIITNAVQREHSNREPAREDCGAFRTPNSSAGRNINGYPCRKCIASVWTGLNVVATAGFNGRGRDSGCPLPPAQTRAGAIDAHGSYLGCIAAKRTLG